MNSKGTPVRLLEDGPSRRRDHSRLKENKPATHSFSIRKEQTDFNPSLYLRTNFSEQDVIAIKEAFDTYDSNNSGLLTPNDLKVALFHHGFHATKETVYSIIAEYDEDCLGGVNFDVFMRIISGEPT